jgi:uncharacterized protein YdhG (YjbR/CyaY superfamily)
MEKERAALENLRRAIREAAPGDEEFISYQIPTYRYHGPLVAFSAAKNHSSFHLMSPSLMQAHRDEIGPSGSTAATIHFTADKPLPVALVKKLVRERVAENLARQELPRKNTPPVRRARNPLPDYISTALRESGLFRAYGERPPYQQNDYLGWIDQAKREDTRSKRLAQMLDELRAGNVYMKMQWNLKRTGS